MNLLSEPAFDDLGCQNTYGVRQVKRNGTVLIKSVKKGGLYYVINQSEINIISNKTGDSTDIKLWHSRL